MSDSPRADRTVWRGLACTRLCLPNGDSAVVSDFGAQVLSWEVNGRERLFLSPRAVMDGSAPIRGGIPVCFPQFNQRGPLPKHGFARTLAWVVQAQGAQAVDDGLQITLQLRDDAATRDVWPHAFIARLTVLLQPGALTLTLGVDNQGTQALEFTAALHGYFRVDDVTQVALHGLEGQGYWDAVADTHPQQQGAIRFGVETDRVYPRAEQMLQLETPDAPTLQLCQDAAWTETVVWNPGPALCARLADMQTDSWQQMLCVEAAAIDSPVVVPAGGQWQAAQYLKLLPATESGQG